MAEMVWCQSCKRVVWAYDHQPKVDLRGICNMLKLPCPCCGVLGNFDGWGGNAYDTAKQLETPDKPVYDQWSGMKVIAEFYLPGITWNPSPDNTWFYQGKW